MNYVVTPAGSALFMKGQNMSYDTSQRLRAVLILLLFGMFCLLLIFHFTNKPIEEKTIEPELPSLIDIQKMLNKIEPNNPIKTDGIYGPATEEKWERVWMNLQAKKYIEGQNNETNNKL